MSVYFYGIEDAREFVYGQPSLREWRDALRDENPGGGMDLRKYHPEVIDYLLDHAVRQGFVVWSDCQFDNPIRVERAGTVFQVGDYVRPVHAKAPLIGWRMGHKTFGQLREPYGRVDIHASALAEVTYSHPNGNLSVRLIIQDDLGELQTSNEDWERVNATDMEYFRRRGRLG